MSQTVPSTIRIVLGRHLDILRWDIGPFAEDFSDFLFKLQKMNVMQIRCSPRTVMLKAGEEPLASDGRNDAHGIDDVLKLRKTEPVF